MEFADESHGIGTFLQSHASAFDATVHRTQDHRQVPNSQNYDTIKDSKQTEEQQRTSFMGVSKPVIALHSKKTSVSPEQDKKVFHTSTMAKK
jgi:hypothetical protein